MEQSDSREANLSRKVRIVLKRHYPGLTGNDVDEALTHVETANGGKLFGLTFKKLFTLMKPFLKKSIEKDKEIHKKEKLDKRVLDATCPFCFTIFIEKFSKDRHVRFMHSDRDTKEGIIGNYCEGEDLLEEIHTSKKPEVETKKSNDKCTECGQMFKHNTSLKRHMKIHKDDPETFPCKSCTKTFKRKDILYRHVSRVHCQYNVNSDALRKSFKKNSICHMCGKDFGNEQILFETHVLEKVCMIKDKIVGINKDMKFQCDICENSYFHKEELNRHCRWKHTSTPKYFKCDECAASYSSKSNLNRHAKKRHGGE